MCCTGPVSFVHGHARDTGWVVAHRRAPHRAEDGQLALPVAVPVPRPVPAAERGSRGGAPEHLPERSSAGRS